jgi:hypothetical protein
MLEMSCPKINTRKSSESTRLDGLLARMKPIWTGHATATFIERVFSSPRCTGTRNAWIWIDIRERVRIDTNLKIALGAALTVFPFQRRSTKV